MGSMSMEDAIDMMLKEAERTDGLVTWDAEADTFDLVGGPHTPGDPYLIRVKTCMTRHALLYWVCHLSTKVWFTRDHLVQLIRVFRARTGVNPRGQ